jgi:hypothetical protein
MAHALDPHPQADQGERETDVGRQGNEIFRHLSQLSLCCLELVPMLPLRSGRNWFNGRAGIFGRWPCRAGSGPCGAQAP